MNLKYYLRGLGLGILVTAVILLIVGKTGSGKGMSDEDVIKRAKELGMVQSTTLVTQDEEDAEQNEIAEVAAVPEQEEVTPVASPTPAQTVEPAEADEKTEENVSEEATDQALDGEDNKAAKETNAEETKQEETKPEESASADQKEEKPETDTKNSDDDKKVEIANPASGDEIITVEVKSGDSSVRVAQRLVEAGLVDDALAYDNYLCENGFDRKLRVGTYQIPAGASDRQIALYVTGQNQ